MAKERNERYSAKLRYHVMKDESRKKDRIGLFSSEQVDKRIWIEIWKVKVSNKVRNFLWRLCTNFVATKENLWKRKIV